MAKLTKYLPALIALLAVFSGIVTYLMSINGQKPDYAALATQVEALATATDQASEIAISEKDYVVCIVTKSTSGLVKASAQSLVSAASGTCHLPDVDVDVSACVALKPVPATSPVEVAPEADPAHDPSEAAQVEVEEAPEPTPAPEPAPKVDSKVVVSAALDPLLALVTSSSASIQDPVIKAWAVGITAWIESGKTDIAALIEDPSAGKLSLKGFDIEGCTPPSK